jgi:DNA-binding beta-propeller fold protein YncE
MYGGSLWTATWNAEKEDFDVAEAYDFASEEVGIPLEIYFNADGTELHVTTANPGRIHFFDISENPAKPKHTKTLEAGEGAHHVAYTKDGKYAYVQNSFINLPGMSEGSITVIDMEKKEVIDTIETFVDNGLNPNCIVLLPEWNDMMGH